MSTTTSLIKQIRSLPYADMMLVATEIRDRIKDLTQQQIEAVVLANILSRLQEAEIPASEQTTEEERVLRELFRVKRVISVTRKNQGWHLNIPTVSGSDVLGTDLRGMLGMMLDQVITLHVLTKK
jgi:hypothetical protein